MSVPVDLCLCAKCQESTSFQLSIPSDWYSKGQLKPNSLRYHVEILLYLIIFPIPNSHTQLEYHGKENLLFIRIFPKLTVLNLKEISRADFPSGICP